MANNKIPDEDLAWLQAHKQSVERRTKLLKQVGLFILLFPLFFLFVFAFDTSLLFISHAISVFALFISILSFCSAIIIIFLLSPGKDAICTSFALGLILGSVIVLLYIAPTASISQYPISMQVFYPNHPNITITQNCTGFTTSESGYFNGQPINLTNTTQCNLPQNMAHPNNYNYYNPFTCSIIGRNITCNSSGLGGINENATWQGIILNVSKR